jgi:hypothetical protein
MSEHIKKLHLLNNCFITLLFAIKLYYILQQHTNSILTPVLIVNCLQLNPTNV